MSKPQPFARVLRQLLDERKMSARGLASATGISSSAIHQALHGGIVPSIDSTERIARVLEVEPETFAEYRLMIAQDALDWRRHGVAKAMKALDA